MSRALVVAFWLALAACGARTDLGDPAFDEESAARCGDSDCSAGESCASCPRDCGVCAGCGDGVCASGEDCLVCAVDCGYCDACGDGRCTAGSEDCYSCPSDCGVCPGCGDGTCVTGETCASCSTDCGGCTSCGCKQYCEVIKACGLGGPGCNGGCQSGAVADSVRSCVCAAADCTAIGQCL